MSLVLVAIAAAAVVAGATLLYRAIRARRTLEYTLDYVEHFRRLSEELETGAPDPDLLGWLRMKAPRMQRLMGERGRVEYFSPEGNYLEREFHVVARTIEEIDGGNRSRHLRASCQGALVSFLSDLNRRYR